MRLLLTTDTVGGVWTFTRELAGELVMRGHHLLLVSFGSAPTDDQRHDTVKLLRTGSFQYLPTEVALEWQPNNEEAYVAGAPVLLQQCEAFRPDALLLSQFCYGALPVSVPKLLIAHSDVLSWANAVGKAPLPENDWVKTYCRLVQTGLDQATAVIGPTAAMLTDLRQNFRCPVGTRVIANGRSIALADSDRPRKLQAVSAGRMWDPAKNLQLLLQADLPLTTLIAGAQTCEQSVPASVLLLGQLGGNALLQLFCDSMVYLCCSLYEPFGLAALEAALCGCAVIASDLPSLREVWGDGALYFRTASELSSLLHSLVDSPSLMMEAQQRSWKRAMRYSTSAMADNYLQALSEYVAPTKEATRAA